MRERWRHEGLLVVDGDGFRRHDAGFGGNGAGRVAPASLMALKPAGEAGKVEAAMAAVGGDGAVGAVAGIFVVDEIHFRVRGRGDVEGRQGRLRDFYFDRRQLHGGGKRSHIFFVVAGSLEGREENGGK